LAFPSILLLLGAGTCPVEFGSQFGLSQNDLDRVAGWLAAMGFTIDEIAAGRSTLTFSGTVAQVQDAFHTAIHNYRIGSGLYYSNVTELEMPQALDGIVSGVAGLNNFGARRRHLSPSPQYMTGDGKRWLEPSDFATIYGLNSLYSNRTWGTGIDIAVLEVCSMDVSLAQTFLDHGGHSPPRDVVLELRRHTHYVQPGRCR